LLPCFNYILFVIIALHQDSFKEDILQIEFGKRFILDVGWLPEHNPKGFFIIRAIKDCDWQNPLLKEKCRTFKDLKLAMEKAVKLINSLRSET